MRENWSHLERYRIWDSRGKEPIHKRGDHFGRFLCPHPDKGHLSFAIIATDGKGESHDRVWEHVSVHVRDVNGTMRTPGWEEMKAVKALFWTPDETVVEFHVPDGQHINEHKHVLHLWRPTHVQIHMPDSYFV